MRLYSDFDINTFDAWSGGEDTKDAIINAGKADLFNALADDIFPDGCDVTQMNDFLRFDTQYIYELLGLDEDGNEPSEEEDEETPDLSAFDDFETFCESFGSHCDGCPFSSVHIKDCQAAFDEAKEKEAAAL